MTSAFGSTTPQQPPPTSAFGSSTPMLASTSNKPKSGKPDFAAALLTVRCQPGLDKYDALLPPNYLEILPKNALEAFRAEKFDWGAVPEFVPPREVR